MSDQAQPPTKRSAASSAGPRKRRRRIAVCVVEEHSDALLFIYNAIGAKRLPLEGVAMLHFDSHPDMLVDRRLAASVTRAGRELLPALSIENWIVPAAAAGHLARVVWLRPPWATQMRDGERTLRVGEERDTGLVRLDSREPYFLADALYARELLAPRDLLFAVYPVGDPDELRADEPQRCAALAAALCPSGPYVLDVDLDYFSTLNPFEDLYRDVDAYERLEEIYRFEPPPEDEPAEAAVERRARLLDGLEAMFTFLQEKGDLNDWPGAKTSIFEKVSRLAADIREKYAEAAIDWTIVHAAGCTRDVGTLPAHESTRAQLESMLRRSFAPFVRALPRAPALVTLARSARDGYCPPADVNYIQQQVLDILKDTFDIDEPTLFYLDQESE